MPTCSHTQTGFGVCIDADKPASTAATPCCATCGTHCLLQPAAATIADRTRHCCCSPCLDCTDKAFMQLLGLLCLSGASWVYYEFVVWTQGPDQSLTCLVQQQFPLTRQPSPMVHACRVAPCPTVTLLPIRVGLGWLLLATLCLATWTMTLS